MRIISIEKVQSGIKLGRAIYNERGKVLLSEGTELTERMIKKLKKFHITSVYIEDDFSEGIEIVEAIPVEFRMEAIGTINQGLMDIADLNVSKPNLQGMMKSARAIRTFQKVFRDIADELSTNRAAINLLATTKIQESFVYGHSLNVAIYSCQLALANGLPIKEIEDIGLGSMLHDIGKLFVPKEILNKPIPLTDDEWKQMKNHCEQGYNIIRKIHEIPIPVAHCALQHHERVDGTGYPRGLMDGDIHRYAKIISVANGFDAVTQARAYRPAILPHEGIGWLEEHAGTRFDAYQVNLFKDCIAIYPQGLTVKLSDGRVGIVASYSVKKLTLRIVQDEYQQPVEPYEITLNLQHDRDLYIIETDVLLPI
ncbi:HD-GYP domain-containing protein [Radiobacillus deserti]|uniref:HD-GYP domain-containing protein n=1 Tax=Radiobacillus deserti TaxID=2594883 RepID=A0A516KKJ3_9BACI|nr:HD-GYP domain-containing protein [Radiobacillus deserti]QDP41902.1 HD-GYP domain-containing protein [Radiobacillus deserti]